MKPYSESAKVCSLCCAKHVSEISTLKVVLAILGRNINDQIHLISPHDPLAARQGREKNVSKALISVANGQPILRMQI